jgi:hypothetical protein
VAKADKDKKKREMRAAELRADIAGLGVRGANKAQSPREMTDAAAQQAWADAKAAKRGKTAKRTR